MEVIVSNVPGCIDHVPEYFVLKSLYNIYIALLDATPELDTVCPYRFWISLVTTSTCRFLRRSLFLTYQGALAICLSTLFWNHCIMSMLLCLVQPHSWIPYVQRGFSICLYKMSLLWRDSEEFLPINP